MLSPNLSEIGAGAVNVGGYIYYVIDAASPSGTMPTYIAPASEGTPATAGGAEASPVPVSTLVPNTPLSNGSIVHVVQPGETLWLIALSYGVKVDDLLSLNQLLPASAIFPGQTLIVRLAATAAPATITSTRTPYPSPTRIPTFTPVPTLAPSPTPARASAVTPTASLTAVMAIVFAALLIAAAFTLRGRARRH
jgi:LysM repeat protein